MDGKDALKLITTGIAGLYTGGAAIIHVAESPARLTLDTVNCRKQWAEAFNRAKGYMAGMAGFAAVSGCAVYYLDKDSDNRLLWLIGSGTLMCAIPWTLLVMLPDIKKLLKEDVIEIAGETWVRDHIARWNKLHAVRTVCGATAFGLFMFAMLKN